MLHPQRQVLEAEVTALHEEGCPGDGPPMEYSNGYWNYGPGLA